MPWGNPIVGGNGVLIRDEIRSSNYIPGVSGWRITRDGIVEFGDGTYRGTIYVQGPNDSYVRIDADNANAYVSLRPPSVGTTYQPGKISSDAGDIAKTYITSPWVSGVNTYGTLEVRSSNAVTGDGPSIATNDDFILGGNFIWADPNKNSDSGTGNGTTTSTSYTNTLTTTGIMGIDFIAPPSGRVIITGTANGFNNTANAYHFLSCETRSGGTIGSGFVIDPSDDNTASVIRAVAASMDARHTEHRLLEGLTPGNQYNSCLTYRVTAGTGSFNRRSIVVMPSV